MTSRTAHVTPSTGQSEQTTAKVPEGVPGGCCCALHLGVVSTLRWSQVVGRLWEGVQDSFYLARDMELFKILATGIVTYTGRIVKFPYV